MIQWSVAGPAARGEKITPSGAEAEGASQVKPAPLHVEHLLAVGFDHCKLALHAAGDGDGRLPESVGTEADVAQVCDLAVALGGEDDAAVADHHPAVDLMAELKA